METKMVNFCTLVAVLGIISAATSFAGEATRVKANDVYVEGDSCVYPSSPALALGLIAAMFAIVTWVYISFTIGRCSFCRNDFTLTLIPNVLYALSWVASVVGVVLLLAAAALNNKEGEEIDSYGYFTCYVVKPGIFAAGGVLVLLSAVFGIAAYVTLTSSSTQATMNPTTEDLEKNPEQL